MNNPFKGHLVCLLGTLLVLSCFPAFAQEKKKKALKNELSDADKKEFALNYFDGTKEKITGNPERALNHFLHCIRIDEKSDAALYEASLILESKLKLENALVFMRSAASLQPENIWYQAQLANLLIKTKRLDEAKKIYESLVKKFPGRVEFYFQWAETCLMAEDYQGAIKVFTKLEELIGLNEDLIIHKQRVFLKLGKLEKAAQEIERLILANPQNPRYYSILAEMYQVNGFPEKAFESIERMEKANPGNPYLFLAKAEYYRGTGDKEKSFQALKQAFSSTGLEIDQKIAVLSSYMMLLKTYPEMSGQAMELARLMVEAHPGDSRSFAILGEFLYQGKNLEDATVQLRKSLELDRQSFLVWEKLIECLYELRDYGAMENESNIALELFPSQPLLYFFNGFSKIQLEKVEESIRVLKSGINLVVDNPPLMVQFYSSLGDAFNKLKKSTESDSSFDKALSMDPNNSYVLNNYSYYLSLRNDSLEKAERMSLLSNQLEPENPSFQDTYGWILYKSGKFSEAKQWIEKAMNARGGSENPVILEHYGDILWKLGMEEKAVDFWHKASEKGKGSDLLPEKIKERKLLE